MRFIPWLIRKRIRKGALTLKGPGGFEETFAGPEPGPAVTVEVTDPGLDRKILLNPELRFGEAYMDGLFDVVEGELRDLMMLLWLNIESIERGPVFVFWKRLAWAISLS